MHALLVLRAQKGSDEALELEHISDTVLAYEAKLRIVAVLNAALVRQCYFRRAAPARANVSFFI